MRVETRERKLTEKGLDKKRSDKMEKRSIGDRIPRTVIYAILFLLLAVGNVSAIVFTPNGPNYYKNDYVWDYTFGAATSAWGANQSTGWVSAQGTAWIGVSSVEASQIVSFYVEERTNVTIRGNLSLLHGTFWIPPAGVAGTMLTMVIDNDEDLWYKQDVDYAFTPEWFEGVFLYFAEMITGYQGSDIAEAIQVINAFNAWAELYDAMEAMEEFEDFTQTVSHTFEPGWHYVRFGARGTATGCIFGMSYFGISGMVTSIEVEGIDLPAAPTLISPYNGEMGVSYSPTVFSWNPVPGTYEHKLQVSRDSNFNNLVFETNTSSSSYSYALDPSSTYYWRVCGRDFNGYGDYSNTWSFSTEGDAPLPPTLSSPSNGATGVGYSPTRFSWNTSSGATSYRLQVSENSSFTNIVYELTTSLTSASCNRDPGTTYWWRVTASNSWGTSGYSDVWHFMTEDEGGSGVTLVEAVTCRWVNGWEDHGPMVTEFDLDETLYAYSQIEGDDLYGVNVRHEWWYQGEWKWEYEWVCGDHYTSYANWTWWDIGLSYGPGTGYIKVYADDVYLGKTNDYTVVSNNPANLVWNPGSHDYGNVEVGEQSSLYSFELTNTGDASTSGSISASGDFHISGSNSYNLAPGGSATFQVYFEPLASGPHTGTLSASSANQPAASLSGYGEEPPPANLVWNPASYDFGSVVLGEQSPTYPFMLTNTGGVVTSGSVSVTGDFYISGSNSYNLGPGEIIIFQVYFEPLALGPHTGTLSASSANQPVVDLSGTGEDPPPANLVWDPVSHDYDSVMVGEQSPAFLFMLSNTGGTATSGSVSTSGDFYPVDSTSYNLDPGESALFQIYFEPLASGPHTGTLSASSANQPVADLSGMGIEPPPAYLVWNPESYDFGEIPLGERSNLFNFQLVNTGGTSTSGSISVTGDFDLTFQHPISGNGTYSLEPGQSMYLQVYFEPLSRGDHTGTLSASSANQPTASVSGTCPDPGGLKASWALDEGMGDVVYDGTGNGYDGLIYGASWVNGVDGSALDFDGVDDYLDIGSIPTNVYTFNFWLKPTETITGSSPSEAIVKFTSGSYRLILGSSTSLVDGETICIQDVTPAFEHRTAVVGLDITHTNWHMLTLAWNSGMDRYDIYYDGEPQTVTNGNASGHVSLMSCEDLLIGMVTSGYFEGMVDDVQLYNRSLDSAEIYDLYTFGLEGYWSFDEGTGDTVFDATTNMYDGTIYGAEWVEGVSGSALDFDGVDDFVDIGYITSAVYAFNLWVKPYDTITSSSPSEAIVKFASGSYRLFLGSSTSLVDGESICIQDVTSGLEHRTAVVDQNISHTNWHMLTLTWNSEVDRYDIYFDGELQQVTNGSSPGHVSLMSCDDLLIGMVTSGYYNGMVDEVRLYNRPLSEAEIGDLYATGDVSIDIVVQDPDFVPPMGGTLELQVLLTNNTSVVQPVEFWLDAALPDGETSKPVVGPFEFDLPPHGVIARKATLEIPGSAPDDIYYFCGHLVSGEKVYEKCVEVYKGD
jgi:hypothetical protein